MGSRGSSSASSKSGGGKAGKSEKPYNDLKEQSDAAEQFNDKDPLEAVCGKKGEPMSMADAIKGVNPKYNPNKHGQYGYNDNCQRCTAATELRVRGYNVEALPYPYDGSDTNNSDNPKSWVNFYKDLVLEEIKNPGSKSYNLSGKQIDSIIKSRFPDNSRGVITMAKGYVGHVMNFEVKKGEVTYYDGQRNKIYKSMADVKKELKFNGGFSAGRIDNLEFNDRMIKKVCKQSKMRWR